MIYKIRYTPQAIDDIRQVGTDVFEASKSKDITIKYLRDLYDAVKKKQLFPQSGIRLIFSNQFTDIYYVHFKAYNAFYRILEDRIEVLRVLLAKSDYMKTLFGEYYEDDISNPDETSYLNETLNV